MQIGDRVRVKRATNAGGTRNRSGLKSLWAGCSGTVVTVAEPLFGYSYGVSLQDDPLGPGTTWFAEGELELDS